MMIPDLQNITTAAEILRSGGLVAFPTETVYGLGANALDGQAVAAIYALKKRPQFNPLIVHVATSASLGELVEVNQPAAALLEAFSPGALTLVLKRKPDCSVSLLASSGLDTLAVRIPSPPIAQALIHAAGVPIAAPSANRSGRVSPTTAQHVVEEFGDALMVLDGGACAIGVESTVVDASAERIIILRPGGITLEQIEAVIGSPVFLPAEGMNAPHSPGMLPSHYAPKLPVRLNATSVGATEALLAFGAMIPDGGGVYLNLSKTGDMLEAAANLFSFLRQLDKSNSSCIAVMPIPPSGIGAAINDRLQRAAAGSSDRR